MVQLLKPSSFLSIAALALSLPASSNAQGFMTCILTGMTSGDFDLQAPLTDLVTAIEEKCCPEGTNEATCTAFKCVDLETMFLNEPCTCGEVETAQKGMLLDPLISGSIMSMMPTFEEDTQAAFDACCPTESTTASEFNTCFAALQTAAPATTTATTAASTNVDDGSTNTESSPAASTTTEPAADTTTTTTTGATEAVTTTTAASTGAAPAPSPSPSPSSANSITSVSFNVLAAYALFNYVM
jgi:hypothetical protein